MSREPLKPADIAKELRHMAADWYADAMRLPDRPEHAAEVARTCRLSDELEGMASAVLAGRLRRSDDGAFFVGDADSKADAVESEIEGVLDSLANEVACNGSNGAPSAVADALTEIMELIGKGKAKGAKRRRGR